MLSRREIACLVDEACAGIAQDERDEMAIPSYLHGNPAIRWIIRKRLGVIAALMRERSCRRWLDFGCGLGLLAHEMAASSDAVFVSDVVLGPVRTLVTRHRLSNVFPVQPGGICDAIAAASLDGVVAADVLEHVDELPSWIDRFASLLKAGGALYLSGPTESPLYRVGRLVAGFSGDYHVRCVHDVEAAFAARGWERVEHCSIPPLTAVSFFRLSVWRPPASSPEGPARESM
jgi:2-polyprenyl-3-methyl-5-hydroxy-6-metoxy-1,4-benzoquinol methylase